jgi:hypothetical protein
MKIEKRELFTEKLDELFRKSIKSYLELPVCITVKGS